MIRFENTETFGWKAAIRGMRNPMNSWDKSDSYTSEFTQDGKDGFIIGKNDMSLMQRLRKAGTDHRKYLRQIVVYVDITAPLYWWKEFDTYKVATVANSCSTMHKIHAKEFTLDDFSTEHLVGRNEKYIYDLINQLNFWREMFNAKSLEERGVLLARNHWKDTYVPTQKTCWWQMIQLLPSSYNQKRTVMINYETLNNIYHNRKNHKLDEWSIGFMEFIESLPYAEELIMEDN